MPSFFQEIPQVITTFFLTSFHSPSPTSSASTYLELNSDHILQQLFMQYHQEWHINLNTTSELHCITLISNHHLVDIIKSLFSILDIILENIEPLLVMHLLLQRTSTCCWQQLATSTSSSCHLDIQQEQLDIKPRERDIDIFFYIKQQHRTSRTSTSYWHDLHQ